MGLGATELVILGLLVAIVLPLVSLFVRRRWLSRLGGTFDCSVRIVKTTPGAGWALGVARYQGEFLEWFRTFSLSVQPTLAFYRVDTVAISQRDPLPEEAVQLMPGERIVELSFPGDTTWELAMDPDSIMALLSWLEAAPPGLRYRTPII